MIGQLLPKPKDKNEQNRVRVPVYSIPCADCNKEYIGETKWQFSTRTGKQKSGRIKINQEISFS